MKLVYVGPHMPGVAVSLPTGGKLDAVWGEPVDIPDSVADGLLAQGTWEKYVAPVKGAVKDTVKGDD